MFIFKGKNSNDMGVYVREENFLGKAPMRYDSIDIEGRHGAELVELGYQNFEGTLNDVVIMNDNFDEALNWLSGTAELIYMGKKTRIHFLDGYQVAKHKKTFSIPFIREPFWYNLEDEYKEPWGANLIPNGWDDFKAYGMTKLANISDFYVPLGRGHIPQEVSIPKQEFYVVYDLEHLSGNDIKQSRLLVRDKDKNPSYNSALTPVCVNGNTSTFVHKIPDIYDNHSIYIYAGVISIDSMDVEYNVKNILIGTGVVRKTPLGNGLIRIQTWGGNNVTKLTFVLQYPVGTTTNTSMYIENKSDEFTIFRWVGSQSTQSVKRDTKNFYSFSQTSKELGSNLLIRAMNKSDNLDFIASTPTIVEGNTPPTWDADSNPRIVNEGTAPAQPLIKLTKGTQATCEYEVNGVYFKYHFNNDDHVIIDCDEMNATYKGLARNRHLTIGFEFPILKPGDNVVKKVSGDAKIEFKRKDRWL